MSMFYDLMMRKKEEIMYATIKGTLTENDGVFSGFSASNYLTLQQQFAPTGNWEIVIKANITTLNVTQTIIGSSTNNVNLQLSLRNTNAIRLYLTYNGSSDTQQTSTLTIDNTGIWFFKISFNGSQYKASVSQDGNSYTDYVTITNSNSIYNNSPVLALGHNGRNTAEYFYGSIDLNNSYIKLGSTKYKLQAVVGYTIVGSPTITDGVVSGFQAYPNVNSGYYVKIANFTYNNTFEIKVKIRTGGTIGGTILGQGNPAPRAGIPVTSLRNTNFSLNLKDQNNQDIINLVNIGYVDARTLIVNTDYILTLKFTGTEYIYTLVDMNGTYYINRVISSSAKLRVGCLAFGINYADVAYTAWGGAIDMNETWIKTDNKLFFNGQQA